MVPPRYAWIIHGWFHEDFWKRGPNNEAAYPVFNQCSREQIISIVNEMIIIHSDPRYDEKDAGNPIIGDKVRCAAMTLVGKIFSGYCVEDEKWAKLSIHYTAHLSPKWLIKYYIFLFTLVFM